MKDQVLNEAKRLYDLGFAIHWLHKKSKRPIERNWTTGPRKDWKELEKSYRPGFNLGVRLGTPSRIKNNFLGVIDVDVKSKDAKHNKEVNEALKNFISSLTLPEVISGRGNGSRHYYILTPQPLKPFKAITSKDIVKVEMPSAGSPSKRETEQLTPQELEKGIRLRPAWEIGIMGDGQQVVLPPSIHPDSGKSYKWQKAFKVEFARWKDSLENLTKPEIDNVEKSVDTVDNSPTKNEPFQIVSIPLFDLPISERILNMIQTGEGVEDRSAGLLAATQALYSVGVNRDGILTILTDPDNYLGQAPYHHAQTKDRQRAGRWLWKYTVKRVFDERNPKNVFLDEPQEPTPISFDEWAANEDIVENERSWTDKMDRTDKGNFRGTVNNVILILENIVGKDIVKRDTFSYRDFYGRSTPWGGVKGEVISDDDVACLKVWVGRRYGFEPNNNVINDALVKIAKDNAFDPVIEWLESLPEWDGQDRLDTWLRDHFEAEGDEDYLAQVFRKWMTAMIIRVYKPGAKFDWMPIFEGIEGVGKSSFGRLLVGDKYFLDWLPDLSDKDSALALQGMWGIEMGELTSMKKNEIETVKAFLTRTTDKVRPPFGKRWIESPRRCVFFGTTNEGKYLPDSAGNRRFKPVKVGRLNFESLKEDRDQLFAEALFLYRSGFENEQTLEIVGKGAEYERKFKEEKQVTNESDLMLGELLDFIEKEKELPADERSFDFGKFQPSGVLGEGLPLGKWKFDNRNAQFAGKAIQKLSKFYPVRTWRSHGRNYLKVDIANPLTPSLSPRVKIKKHHVK